MWPMIIHIWLFMCLACIDSARQLENSHHLEEGASRTALATYLLSLSAVNSQRRWGVRFPRRGEQVMDAYGLHSNDARGNLTRAETFRKLHGITLKGTDAEQYEPLEHFESTPFSPAILDIFKEQGYSEPFPIQSQTWPIALDGRDLVSIGRSGSGKTVAFLAPGFQKLFLRPCHLRPSVSSAIENSTDEQMIGTKVAIPHRLVAAFAGKNNEKFNKLAKKAGVLSIELSDDESQSDGEDRTIIIKGRRRNVHAVKEDLLNAFQCKVRPRMLVLAPTRELVTQIYEEVEKYTRAGGVRALRLVGASRKEQQIFLLRTIRPEIIVATPGRCKDLEEMGELYLSDVEYLVLDEADRMLDLGFFKPMRGIIKQIRYSGPRSAPLQISMFSATWPEKVRSFSSYFLKDPVILMTGENQGLNANEAITQHVKVVKQKDKEIELLKVLDELNPDTEKNPDAMPQIMIFCALKKDCNKVRDIMKEKGYNVGSLHGDLPQFERTKVLNRFINKKLKAMVTTEVAARGLDIPDVEAVINYDMPRGKDATEFYIHRIGRTGRGNERGLSYTFFSEKDDRKSARKLTGVLRRAKQDVPKELEALGRILGKEAAVELQEAV